MKYHLKLGCWNNEENTPETQVVWVKFLMLCWANFLERLRTIAIVLLVF